MHVIYSKNKSEFYFKVILQREMSMWEIEQSLYSWLGHAEQGDTWKLRRRILDRFVFAKEGDVE